MAAEAGGRGGKSKKKKREVVVLEEEEEEQCAPFQYIPGLDWTGLVHTYVTGGGASEALSFLFYDI